MDITKGIKIGRSLDETTFFYVEVSGKEQEDLNALLRKYNHIFTRQHEQMPRVDPEVAYHKLDVNPNVKPVKQKPVRMNPDYKTQVQAKVDRLLSIKFIEKAKYMWWVSNIVVVLK